MTSRTVARRYAKGLLTATLEVAPEALRDVAEDLASLAATIARHDALRLLVVNPAIDADTKLAVLDRVAERLQVHAILRRFLRLAAEKQRLDHVELIADVFHDQVDRHEGVLTARITTPTGLEDDEIESIRSQLAEATGRPVRLGVEVDPELLGGMITRIGDVVYDGSLRRHLARIQKELSSP